MYSSLIRHGIVCNTFQEPTVTSIIDAEKTTICGESGFPSEFLAFNTLRTETEKTQHIGFAALLKGCFMAVRNPLAHEPKIMWDGEDDAADYFTLISLLHRKLDDCVHTEIGGGP